MIAPPPVQPTQPSRVSNDTLTRETGAVLASDTFSDLVAETAVENGNIAYCLLTLTCLAYVEGTIDGGIIGAASALAVAMDGDRTVYDGEFKPFIPFVPFEKPNAGLRYGGAALAVAGAAVAALWSSVPVMRDVSVSPTRGGVAVGSRIGF